MVIVDRSTFARLVQHAASIQLESAYACIDLVLDNILYVAKREGQCSLKCFGRFEWDGVCLEYVLPKVRIPVYKRLTVNKPIPVQVPPNESLFAGRCLREALKLGPWVPGIPPTWSRVTADGATNARHTPADIGRIMKCIMRLSLGLLVCRMGWSWTDGWFVRLELTDPDNRVQSGASDQEWLPALRYPWEL